MKRARERIFGSTNSSPCQGFTCGPSLYSQTNFRIVSNSLLPITPYGSDQLDRLSDQSGSFITTVLHCLTWTGVPDGVQKSDELRVTHRYSIWFLKIKNSMWLQNQRGSALSPWHALSPFFCLLFLFSLGRKRSKKNQ
jgi:hypothetical protein